MKQFNVTINPNSKNAVKGTLTVCAKGYLIEATMVREDGTSYKSFDSIDGKDICWEAKTALAHYEKSWVGDDGQVYSRMITFELGKEINLSSDDEFRKKMGW